MGWLGYTLYAGDSTQSCHSAFLEWAGIEIDYDTDDGDEYYYSIFTSRGTFIPKDLIPIFVKNINKVLKKMPKIKMSRVKNIKYWDEYNALEWQMLLALFVDNKLKIPQIIYDNGIEATEFLMGEHASDFDKPWLRRAALKRFITKAGKIYDDNKNTK